MDIKFVTVSHSTVVNGFTYGDHGTEIWRRKQLLFVTH